MFERIKDWFNATWIDSVNWLRGEARLCRARHWLSRHSKKIEDLTFIYGEDMKPMTAFDLHGTFWNCLQVISGRTDVCYYRIDGLMATCSKSYTVSEQAYLDAVSRYEDIKRQIEDEMNLAKVTKLMFERFEMRKKIATLMVPLVTFKVYSWMPGRLIGMKGKFIDDLKEMLSERLEMKVEIDIEEIRETGTTINILKPESFF